MCSFLVSFVVRFGRMEVMKYVRKHRFSGGRRLTCGAAILATVQGLYAKYKKVNDYTKVLIFLRFGHSDRNCYFGSRNNRRYKPSAGYNFLRLFICLLFLLLLFMFGSTIKALSATHGIIEDIARYGANNHNNKPD